MQPDAPSIYQPISDNGQYSSCSLLTELTPRLAPTRAQILQRLTRLDAPGLNEAPGQNHEQPALAFWVNDGVELEEAQYVKSWILAYLLILCFRARLCVFARTINEGSLERERIDLNRRRVNIRERINNWKARAPDGVQDDAEEEDDDGPPENLKLPLPSSFPVENQEPILQEMERQLREGYAFDNLRALRKGLAERVALQREKERHLRGQAANFRSQAALNRLQAEIMFVANRYRRAYEALHDLGGNINRELATLTEEDVSIAGIFEYTRQLGRGYNTAVSWIWGQTALVAQAQDDNWLDEGLLELVTCCPEPQHFDSTPSPIPRGKSEPRSVGGGARAGNGRATIHKSDIRAQAAILD
jgi:hypothetical protein